MVDVSEAVEEQSSREPDIHRYLDVVRRRHMTFLLAVLIGWLLVWGAGWVLPARYKSSTLILVEQPTMPKNYVEPNINEDLQDRLQSITQQIMSRTRLLLIIEKLHLYSKGRANATPDDKVELMRKDISIELVRGSQSEQITAFRVYYSARDPRVAQQVTTELTDLFINENLKVRAQQSEDTTKFLERQLENARATLAEQEAKVREFEGKHEGELPSQEASNLQILSGLQAQLQNEQDSLNTARQQRVYYQTLIEQYHAAQANGTSLRNADAAPTQLTVIDQELDRLRARLADVGSHYTDRHPDIQSLKIQIAKTEKMRADLVAGVAKGEGVKPAGSGTSGRGATNSPHDPATQQLQSQLQANQAEIANREQAISALKARVNTYQARLSNEPARQQELADLTRGYDQSKANYDDLLKKKNGSEMATSMEQMQQGERFRMLDPPSLPTKPDFPNRMKLCGIGLGAGLVLGIVVVCGFEIMDDRLHSQEEIQALLPVAIISEIPEILVPSEERRHKRKMALGWAIDALAVGAILAGSAISYFHS